MQDYRKYFVFYIYFSCIDYSFCISVYYTTIFLLDMRYHLEIKLKKKEFIV